MAMSHINVRKGLTIPISGKPQGEMRSIPKPKTVALNLSHFDDVKFKLYVKKGEHVKIGQPIADDKSSLGRFFVSPGSGTIVDVIRGVKRRLLYVVIELDEEEQFQDLGTLNPESASKEELIVHLKKSGLFSHIRKRPFNLLANPEQLPRDIFIKGVDSAPFSIAPENQVIGFEEEFQIGLDALNKLTDGQVHLVYQKESTLPSFTQAQNVEKHTVSGPHPSGNTSVHIHHIAPISFVEEVVWTLNVHDVVTLGYSLSKGHYFIERKLSIAGNGITSKERGFYKGRAGLPISTLTDGRNESGWLRFISGNPLCGSRVKEDQYLGFQDYAFCAIPESEGRQFLHFFQPGFHKYSSHKAYASGHTLKSEREFNFDTNQHGEHRAFIDSSIYDKVMPMHIPTIPLVKAIIGNDFDSAEELGLLEVDGEDFALSTFIDPCKNEMVEIVNKGLKEYAKDVS
jgi:Na+-transporting NADH:ubiquinone oxidoreductase subunit A